ncbi:uncharacterized protein [Chelonus insularis]|uniref:uncharacterized protein n=1 Tax=Chelonus insularis TaxID=460826 RepID=UPI00158D698D|nr:uncharacterized protein LOC118067329 [Chelonus insularis]
MVKFVGLVLLGFAACLAVAIPPSEDSNEHIRIRRLSIGYQGGSEYVGRHGDHVDTIEQNPDGSVSRVHNIQGGGQLGGSTYQTLHGDHVDTIQQRPNGITRVHNNGVGFGVSNGGSFGVANGGFNSQPHYPNYNTGYNGNYNPGQINVPGHGHGPHHHHPEATAEIIEFSVDELGHDVATKTEVFSDGHVHKKTTHI